MLKFVRDFILWIVKKDPILLNQIVELDPTVCIVKNRLKEEHRKMSAIFESAPYQFTRRIEHLAIIGKEYDETQKLNDYTLIKRGVSATEVASYRYKMNLIFIMNAIRTTNPMYDITALEETDKGVILKIDSILSPEDMAMIMEELSRELTYCYMKSYSEIDHSISRLCQVVELDTKHVYRQLVRFIGLLNQKIYDKCIEIIDNTDAERLPVLAEYLDQFTYLMSRFPNISKMEFDYKTEIVEILNSNIVLRQNIIRLISLRNGGDEASDSSL